MEKSPLTENFHHVGLIVRDADRVAEYYESLGIGPFEPFAVDVIERKFRGKPLLGAQLKIRMAHVGSTRIEIIQPVAGKGPWGDFLDRHGEGILELPPISSEDMPDSACGHRQSFMIQKIA